MENLNQTGQCMRVGLLDFEPLRIAGLREIFTERADFQVTAIDWAAAFRDSSFDLVVVVLRDQAFSLALLARLRSRHPTLKILAMGMGAEPEKILEVISVGAKGWLEDTATPSQVMQASYAILNGSIWAPRRVLSTFVDRAIDGATARRRKQGPQFTEREEEVLQQLVLARSNREIAQALSIREQTVKSYVARLMRKVGVGNRIALSVQAASGAWGDKDR